MLCQILVKPSAAETLAFAAAHGGLTDAQAVAIEVFVRRLKLSGWWAKATAIYPCVGTTWAQQRLNLKDPATLLLDPVASAPTVGADGITGGANHATVTVPISTATQRNLYLRYKATADGSAAPLLTSASGIVLGQGIDGPGSFGATWGTDARVQLVWPYDSEVGHRSLDLGLAAATGLKHVRSGGAATYWQSTGGTGDAATLPTVFTLLPACPHTLGHFALIDDADTLGGYGRYERDLAAMLGRAETDLRSDVQLWSDGTTRLGSDGEPLLRSNP